MLYSNITLLSLFIISLNFLQEKKIIVLKILIFINNGHTSILIIIYTYLFTKNSINVDCFANEG